MRLVTGLVFTLTLSVLPAPAAAAFTIEQILSSPFPTELRASPRGDAVAWVMDAKGVRNIWVARAPDFAGVPITSFREDDGQDLGDLTWRADSSTVFFTRGGSVNGHGDFPNPRSIPAGVRQEIWTATLDGKYRKMGEGHSPQVSPDGSSVAWIYSGQIWSTALAGEPKPSQLIHARGSARDLTWSPDGTRLAFTSDRGDHALIGVYDVREKKLNFPDPGVDTDGSAAWSKDGKTIAFIRIPANRLESLYGAKRTGQPWSIRMVDPAGNEGHEIWRAAAGTGSVFWPAPGARQLLFTSGNRLVFPWERDGWLHLYSIAVSGNAAPLLLTPGRFEAEYPTVSADGKDIVYSSNQDDADRKHLWRVPAAGGTPKRLTTGSGIEWEPAPLSDGRIALLRSDARLPARASILESSGSVRDLAPSSMPPDFPSAALTEPQAVMFPASDGMQIHAQLFLPPGAESARHPAVVFFHGGSRRQMLLGWNPMSYYHQAYGFNQYLASKGYVVLSVNYRSGIGYGEEFREALNFGPTGASEYNDVTGAARFLHSRNDVDPARIGLWGGSYGGYLTALGLARASDMFAAGVDLHGVHDWNLELGNRLPAYEPEKRLAVARTAFDSSPMASIATWRSPVLLIQGDDDRNVLFAQTVQLTEALRDKGVPVEVLVFPDEIHDFLIHSHWVHAYETASDFLVRQLLPRK